MRLDPHQEQAVEWLLAHPRGGLFDAPRVGKTYPTIVAACRAEARKILVLCPALARTYWRETLQAMVPVGVEHRVESYERLSRRGGSLQYELASWIPDTVILDEAHYLKSMDSKRTQLVYGEGCDDFTFEAAERVWLLTGTPAPNHGGELWTHFRALFREEMSLYRWLRHYHHVRDTEHGPRVIRLRDETAPELRAKIREKFLRRTFKQVFGNGKEPLVFRPVELGSDDLALRLTRAGADAILVQVAGAIERGEDVDEMAFATLRRLTARIKADLVSAYVTQYLEDNPKEKVLLLGYHREALERVQEQCGGGLLLGGLTDTKREAVRQRFHAPGSRLLSGQIGACGVAIDLSCADVVVMMERDWVPGNNVQAAMRAVLRGKDRVVPVDVIGLAGSVDAVVARVEARKMQMVNQIL